MLSYADTARKNKYTFKELSRRTGRDLFHASAFNSWLDYHAQYTLRRPLTRTLRLSHILNTPHPLLGELNTMALDVEIGFVYLSV